MKKPNFLIIGAMKSGTTVLYHALKQHPDIFAPETKELHFFSVIGRDPHAVPLEGAQVRVSRWEKYLTYFRSATSGQKAGEASVSYLYTPWAAENIKKFLPGVKLVCILRNPVDRAYSHYLWLRRIGLETSSSFETALEVERERTCQGSDFGRYVQVGYYYQQLTKYYSLFSPEQLHILLYDDLVMEPSKVIRRVYNFLEVNSEFAPSMSVRRNPSGLPRYQWLENVVRKHKIAKEFVSRGMPEKVLTLLYKIRDWNLVKPSLSPATHERLFSIYRDEILRLQELLQRDLSMWLTREVGYEKD